MHTGDKTGHPGRQHVSKQHQLRKVFWRMRVPKGLKHNPHEELWYKTEVHFTCWGDI